MPEVLNQECYQATVMEMNIVSTGSKQGTILTLLEDNV